MKRTNDTYKYLQSKGSSQFEYAVDCYIGGDTPVTISAANVKSCVVSRDLYASDTGITIGGTPSAMLKFSFRSKDVALPRGAKISIRYRLTGYELAPVDPSNPQSYINHTPIATDWFEYYTGYVSSRDIANGFTTVTCYDAMQKLNKPLLQFYEDGTPIEDLAFPLTLRETVEYICSEQGLSLDTDTAARITQQPYAGYAVEYPNDRTMRSVLGAIGAALCGNWVITSGETLKLVQVRYDPANLYTEIKHYDTCGIGKPYRYSRVTLSWGGMGSSYFTAGSDDADELDASCYFATSDIAHNAHALLHSNVNMPIHGFKMTRVRGVDPAIELGDVIAGVFPAQNDPNFEYATEMLSSNLVVVASMTCRLSNTFVCDFSAPIKQEDDEYPFENQYTEALKQRVSVGEAYEGVEITRTDGLVIKNTADNYKVALNSRGLDFQFKENNTWARGFWYNAEAGRFEFNGQSASFYFKDGTGNYTNIVTAFDGVRVNMSANINAVVADLANKTNNINGALSALNNSTFANLDALRNFVNSTANTINGNVSNTANNINAATNNKANAINNALNAANNAANNYINGAYSNATNYTNNVWANLNAKLNAANNAMNAWGDNVTALAANYDIRLNGFYANFTSLAQDINNNFAVFNTNFFVMGNKLSYIMQDPFNAGTNAASFQVTPYFVNIMAAHMKLKGLVTFEDLSNSSSQTIISGDTIQTGIIQANYIDVINLNVKSLTDALNQTVLEIGMYANNANWVRLKATNVILPNESYVRNNLAYFTQPVQLVNTLTIPNWESIIGGGQNIAAYLRGVNDITYNFQNNYFYANSIVDGVNNGSTSMTVAAHINMLKSTLQTVLGLINTNVSTLGLTINSNISALNGTLRSYIGGAQSTADSAHSLASGASSTASSAYSKANSASSLAQQAYDRANSAYGQANTATSTASSAYQTANGAASNASSAYNKANSAYDAASSAYSRANSAYGQANSAYSQANTANTKAQFAYDRANAAYNATPTLRIFSLSGSTLTINSSF